MSDNSFTGLQPQPFTIHATVPSYAAAADLATAFNRVHTVGEAVIYWPHGFAAPARIAPTRGVASPRVLPPEWAGNASLQFAAEVYVDGHGPAVPLAHVARITPENMRGVLRLEFTASVILDLELRDRHVLTDLQQSIAAAVRPLHKTLAARLESEDPNPPV